MAIYGIMEIAGCHRGNDWSFCGNGSWYCLHRSRHNRQPDNRWRDRGNPFGHHWRFTHAARDFLAESTIWVDSAF